jgi:hypothetical protein
MSRGWALALDDFEARIEAIELALRTGGWEAVPAWSPPADPLEPPSGAEAERLRRLLDRAERCRRLMLAALERSASRIAREQVVRRAARGYLSAPR